jgi:hypothetical protein
MCHAVMVARVRLACELLMCIHFLHLAAELETANGCCHDTAGGADFSPHLLPWLVWLPTQAVGANVLDSPPSKAKEPAIQPAS